MGEEEGENCALTSLFGPEQPRNNNRRDKKSKKPNRRKGDSKGKVSACACGCVRVGVYVRACVKKCYLVKEASYRKLLYHLL